MQAVRSEKHELEVSLSSQPFIVARSPLAYLYCVVLQEDIVASLC